MSSEEKRVEEGLDSATKEINSNELESVEIINKEPEIEEDEKSQALPKVKESSNLHSSLVDKLTQAKIAAGMKHEEYLQVHKELEETTVNFMRLENNIVKTTVDTSLTLLEELGVQNLENGLKEAKEIVQENKAELLQIKSISKGNIKAFFFGAIGAVATAIGLTAFGAKLAALPLNSATLLQSSNLETIATKVADLIKIKDTPIAGYLLVGAVSFLVGLLIYNLVKFLQKKKNIRYVNNLESDVQTYEEQLNEKVEKSHELNEHLDHIKLVMQKYDIILQEQNAKLRRMQFIEQPVEGVNSLQRASQIEVEKTVLILDELLKLMNTEVNDNLDITQESKEQLHSANSIINEVIKKLYI
ncbi:MAG TPA: hypothetical protein ENK87_01980 [Nitratifractor sp.]|nr:hypothetical protein [Nitratifractor sp.]HHH20673.1 hypothetical protein [Nitratifractor sp.]